MAVGICHPLFLLALHAGHILFLDTSGNSPGSLQIVAAAESLPTPDHPEYLFTLWCKVSLYDLSPRNHGHFVPTLWEPSYTKTS